MAAKSIAVQDETPKTVRVEFDHATAHNANLLCVLPGVDVTLALSQADLIDNALRLILKDCLQYGDGLKPDVAWFFQWSMEASHAYREAAGAVA